MNRDVCHSPAPFPPLRLLQKLIEWGIDLNNYNNDHVTPIMLAAKQGDREIVEALLEGNADPSYENEQVPTYSRLLMSMLSASPTTVFPLHN